MTDIPVSLRASPARGIGGMYATGGGKGDTVRTAALRPPFVENQQWIIVSVPGESSDTRVQIFWTNEPSLGWSIQSTESGGNPGAEARIVLEPKESENVTIWIKQPYSVPGVEDAFTLHAENVVIGATWYAGTNKETKEVVIKTLPVVADPGEPPYWVVKPIFED